VNLEPNGRFANRVVGTDENRKVATERWR
jgi:hypothetical protein